jgi:hypothetical protein
MRSRRAEFEFLVRICPGLHGSDRMENIFWRALQRIQIRGIGFGPLNPVFQRSTIDFQISVNFHRFQFCQKFQSQSRLARPVGEFSQAAEAICFLLS